MNILVRCIGIPETYIRDRRLQDILLVIIHLTAFAVPALLQSKKQFYCRQKRGGCDAFWPLGSCLISYRDPRPDKELIIKIHIAQNA